MAFEVARLLRRDTRLGDLRADDTITHGMRLNDNMRLITFDPLRTLDMPDSIYVKPDRWTGHMDLIREADFLLFPEYWQAKILHFGFKKRIFPSISTYLIGHDKVEMTRMVQMMWPQNLPETIILPNCDSAGETILERFDFPFVAKSARASMGTGVWLIRDKQEWTHYTRHHDLLYVQEYLPIERDLRVVVIGRQVVTAYWRHRPEDGFHTNVARGGRIDPSQVPSGAVALVAEMATALQIDHAGFDIAEVDGQFFFFEFNRLFGTDGLRRQGIHTGRLIYAYLSTELPHPHFPPKAA